MLACVGGGTALGWWLSSQHQGERALPAPSIVEVAVPDYDDQGVAAMPDVRGLSVDAARETISDAGIPADLVTTTSRPAAGAVGVVIEQTPAFGTDRPTAVQLVVSELATIPAATGQPASTIASQLEQLGARVEQHLRYVAGAAPGTVLSITPAEGQPVPADVVIEVSEPPSAIFLDQLSPIDGYCSTGNVSLNGIDYEDALTCSASSEPSDVSWLLGRHVDAIDAIVGVSDTDGGPTKVRIEVIADGHVVATAIAAYGVPAELKGIVTGALRMTIRVTAIDLPPDSFSSVEASLGDFKLIGSSAAIALLQTDSP